MRHSLFPLAVLLSTAGLAHAQVTVDLHALDSLPIGSGVLARPAPYIPGPKPAAHPTLPAQPKPPAVEPPRAASAAPATPPALPDSVPATASLPPAPSATSGSGQPASGTGAPAAVVATPPAAGGNTASSAPSAPPPMPAMAPPPAPAAVASAAPPPPGGMPASPPGEAGQLRLNFGADQVELTPADIASLRQLSGPSADKDARFTVAAYAAGSNDDPSAARRLSLSRALAVRSALIADGIPSARIFVRALGAQAGNGPPDRVDVGLVGAGATPTRSP